MKTSRSEAGGAELVETQETIYAWGQETFGRPSVLAIFARFGVEAAELLDLLVRERELSQRFEAHRDVGEASRRETWRELMEVRTRLADELADVQIVLDQVAEGSGVNLDAARQRKMRVNRARQWRTLPGGRHQHVDGT